MKEPGNTAGRLRGLARGLGDRAEGEMSHR